MVSRELTHADLQAAGLLADQTRGLLGDVLQKPPTTLAWAIYEDQFDDPSGVSVFAGGDYIVPRRFFGTYSYPGIDLAFEVEVDQGRFLFRQLVERLKSNTHPFELDDEHNRLVLEMVKELSGFVAVTVRQTRTGIKVELARRDRAGAEGWFDAYLSEVKPHKAQRGRRLEPAHFEQVADTYRVAVQGGAPPTQAVTDKFQVPYSTAGRWVMEARRRGFLAPAPAPGQPGEKRDTTDG